MGFIDPTLYEVIKVRKRLWQRFKTLEKHGKVELYDELEDEKGKYRVYGIRDKELADAIHDKLQAKETK